MTNYTKTTDFAAKDALPSGNSAKIVKGTEIDTEFNNIATASATKANKNDAALTGTTTFETISDGTIAITAFVDEDNMASDSATLLPTQQSVKAYVDSQVTAQDLDVTDGSTSIDIDLDSESLGILGGTGIDSTALGTGVTLAIDSTVATLTGSQTLSNKTLSAPVVSGNLTTDGLLDGRDVAADGTKLDGIESGATADQTAAEIKTAYESNANTNAFTDADESKLDGIEASADVTDTANVTAAGALMDSELTSEASVKALNQGVATTDSPTFAGLTTTADVSFGDNDKAIFGAGNDLQIYHDGSNSYVRDAGGTGNLILRGQGQIILQSDVNQESYLVANNNGGVELYHDNAQKLATTSTGIDVTGTVTLESSDAGAGEGPEIFLHRNSASPAASDVLGVINFDGENSAGSQHTYGKIKGVIVDPTNTSEDGKLVFQARGAGAGFSDIMTVASTGIDVTGSVTADGLTVDGASAGTVTAATFTNTTSGNGTRVQAVLQNVSGACNVNLVSERVGANFGADFIVETSDTVDGTDRQRLRVAETGDISFYEDTGTTPKLFWDSSAESLGIGTTSPSNDLHIKGAGAANIRLEQGNGSNYGLIKQNQTLQSLQLGVGGSFGINIDSANNVGIGTDSPASQLELSSATGATLRLSRDDTTVVGPNSIGLIEFYTADTGSAGVGASIEGVADGSGGNVALAFSSGTGGSATEAMRIDSSGNLLVGTTDNNPVNNSANTSADNGVALGGLGVAVARYNNTPMFANRTGTDGTIFDFRKSGSPVGSIGVASSDMYIGTNVANLRFFDSLPSIVPATSTGASSDNAIDLGWSGGRFKDLYLSGDVNLANDSHIQFASSACRIEGTSSGADYIKFITNSSEGFRLDSSGNLLVGTTGVPDGTSVYGAGFINTGSNGLVQLRLSASTTASLSIARFYNPNGNVGSIQLSGSVTSYVTSSDQRLKENIADADDAGSKVDAIQVRKFDWIADGSHQDYGMVAQELQSVAPEAVSASEDPEEMMGVDYSKLVPMLVKEIQSLRARVAQLENN